MKTCDAVISIPKYHSNHLYFSDITENQINRKNAAISVPKYAINHLPIVKVTEKAICIEIDRSSWVHKSIKYIWLPISQITINKTFTMNHFINTPCNENEKTLFFEIDLPEWLVRKNKL